MKSESTVEPQLSDGILTSSLSYPSVVALELQSGATEIASIDCSSWDQTSAGISLEV